MKLADEILLLESVSGDRIAKAVKAFTKSKGKSKSTEDALRVVLLDLRAIRRKLKDNKLLFKIDRDIENISKILLSLGARLPRDLNPVT